MVTSQNKDSIFQDNEFNEVSFDQFELVRQILRRHWNGNRPWELTLIGGTSIYEQFWDYVEEAHITEVQSKFPDADTFFKPDLTGFEKVGDEIDVGNGELEAYVQVWRLKTVNKNPEKP